MLELGSIRAQYIEPIIDVFTKAFQVGASRELLQPFGCSIFDCVRASSKFNVEQTPHFEADSMLASSQWNPPSIHVLGNQFTNNDPNIVEMSQALTPSMVLLINQAFEIGAGSLDVHSSVLRQRWVDLHMWSAMRSRQILKSGTD